MDNNSLKKLARSLVEKLAVKQLASGYRPAGLHPYHDPQNNLLYFRIRLKHSENGDKWIRPFHFDSSKQEHVMGEPNFPLGKPIYRLYEITKNSENEVWIFEGESCVEVAERIGLLATTSGSATSTSNTDWTSLQNRKVIIWPDNDKEGLQYSKDVTKKLTLLNCHIRYVDIKQLNLPQKGDIADWVRCNPHTDIKKIPLIEASPIDTGEQSKILYSKASDIEPAPINWLWQDHFARGKYSMIVGDPGLGKSQFTAYIAAVVTQGDTWPDGTRCNQEGSVIILSAEDDPACTIVPRLIAARAKLDQVNIIEAVKAGFDSRGNQILKQFDLITDVAELDKMLTTMQNVAAVIIDPISAYLGNTNSHNNSDVRSALTPVSKLAEKHNVAIICVSHLNKTNGGNAISRVSGSIAFTATSRATFAVIKDKDDANKPGVSHLIFN